MDVIIISRKMCTTRHVLGEIRGKAKNPLDIHIDDVWGQIKLAMGLGSKFLPAFPDPTFMKDSGSLKICCLMEQEC